MKIPEKVLEYVRNCKVSDDCHVDSDHRLLVTSMETPMNRKARWKPPTDQREKPLDLNSLQHEDVNNNFVTHVKNTVKVLSEILIETLKSAARLSLPGKKPKMNREIWKDDAILNNLLHQRCQSAKQSDEHKKLTRAIKRRVATLRSEKIKQEAQELNIFANK